MTNAMVMNKAWEIARKGQSKFGGKVIEYIAQALKMAWALVKKEEKQMEIKKIGLVTNSFKERVLEVAKNQGIEVKLFNGPNGAGHIIVSNNELKLEGYPKTKYYVIAEVKDSDWNSGIRLIATDSIDEIKDEITEEKPEKTNEKEEKAKMNKVKLSDFDQFRFGGLEVSVKSNKYYRINRVSTDENKIIVKVADSHLIETRYGYALILDDQHVVFVKPWQVEQNFYGNEVLLNREYFKVKKWGQHDNFFANEENHSFDRWLTVAKEQEQSGNMVNWQK